MYERISLLGTGAFSEVWMARPKIRAPCPNHTKPSKRDYVAMKTTVISVRDNPTNAAEYVEREILILKELDHPNIVKFVKEFNYHHVYKKQKLALVKCVALSLARGPTVQQLVEYGGALGIPMAKLISRQLISALAYMHGRAVMHRDIKPDNVILVGASLSDDLCWCDEYKGGEHLPRLEEKWKVVLVDFGFARALYPEEVNDDIGMSRNLKDQENDAANPTDGIDDTNLEMLDLKMTKKEKKSQRTHSYMDESISKRRLMDMSAVGNRYYVAPEILRRMHSYAGHTLNLSHSLSRLDLSRSTRSKTKSEINSSINDKSSDNKKMKRKKHVPLSEKVADYGIIAESFSLGVTLRYIMTGVPPSYDINDYINFYNSPAVQMMRLISKLFTSCSQNNQKGDTTAANTENCDTNVIDPSQLPSRKKRFRRTDEVPKEVRKLILGLTLWNEQKRTTIRAAQSSPWIALKEGETVFFPERQDNNANSSRSRIDFLSFVKCKEDAESSNNDPIRCEEEEILR